MRKIVGQLTKEIELAVGLEPVAKAPPFAVRTFRELMQHVARLSYANKDYLLFFRGQASDHINKAGSSTFYPSIYRGERLSKIELDLRFDVLTSAGKRLVESFVKTGIEGASELRRRKLIQWSILQHYEVCATPLLDFTQSVRVACSFALADERTDDPFVFAFGLPYVTNRVSVNSEHDLVNVRLLSICPPDALRPYFQEGYLVGTDEMTTDYPSKNELDFNNRLIAKFRISRSSSFWAGGFAAIPHEALYPSDDRIQTLCATISRDVAVGPQASELGTFLQAWTALESRLLTLARTRTDRVYSINEAIRILEKAGSLPSDLTRQLNRIREIRNAAVHSPDQLKSGDLGRATGEIDRLHKQVGRFKADIPE